MERHGIPWFCLLARIFLLNLTYHVHIHVSVCIPNPFSFCYMLVLRTVCCRYVGLWLTLVTARSEKSWRRRC